MKKSDRSARMEKLKSDYKVWCLTKKIALELAELNRSTKAGASGGVEANSTRRANQLPRY